MNIPKKATLEDNIIAILNIVEEKDEKKKEEIIKDLGFNF